MVSSTPSWGGHPNPTGSDANGNTAGEANAQHRRSMSEHHIDEIESGSLIGIVPPVACRKPGRNLFDIAKPVGGDECLGVPDCVTQRSSVEVLGGGQQLAITVSCDGKRPHAWQWDAQSHGHIQSSLQQRTPTGLTVLTENVATIDGAVTILVGCSTEPFDAVRAAARRPRSAKVRHRELLGWPDPGGTVCDAWSIPGESSPAVPECIPVVQAPTPFDHFLQSHVTDYPCPADHPYFWPPHYTWDSSCFSCVDWTTSPPPPTALELQCTLWCSARDVTVTSACSKLPFDDGCHDPVTLTSDPGCPMTNQGTHCAGVPPVCFITWNEQCTKGSYAGYDFSCTADNGFLFCNGCNGP
jgi:hypothetical protein